MKFRLFLNFILILPFLIKNGESANILVTVVGIAGSQNLVMYRLADLMGERGHNVTVLKAEFLPEAKSIPLKHGKEISYSLIKDDEIMSEIRSTLSTLTWTQSESTPLPLRRMTKIFGEIRRGCERFLDNENLIKSLNDSKFDVMVIHLVDFCSFGLTRVLNIDAYVWMSTFFLFDPMAWYSGSPLGHSYVPNIQAPSNPDGRLSFLERIKNLFSSILMLGIFQYGVVGSYTEVFRNKYGSDFPSFDEIFKKTQLYFVNSDPNFEYARPVAENVINVGGLTMKKAEPLTKEWQKIVDNAPKEGIVIFSLGSVANTTTMPQEIRLSFLSAFKRFPHLFIWKFEGDFPEAKEVKNVHLAKWLPQKDLMAQPNVKAAIIHGGYNSLTETTYMGVPVVVLPLWGDQFGNAVRVTRQNIGAKLDRKNMDENMVYEALKKVLYDETVQASAKQLGKMIREKPFSSLQQATEWLEYLAKFKRLDQLQPQSHDLYLFQYLLLDIAICFSVLVFVFFGLIYFCVRFCLKKCRKSEQKKEGKREKKE